MNIASLQMKLALCCILGISLYFTSASATVDSSRNVTVQYNPDCNIPSCFGSNLSVHLIYAKSMGTDNSFHYVVSTIGSSVPTLLLLKSNQEDARLAVDWDKLLSNSPDEASLNGAVKLINKTGQQDHPLTAVYLFSQILGYNDSFDTVDVNNPNNTHLPPLFLNQARWNVSYSNSSALFNGTGFGQNGSRYGENAWLALNFDFFDQDGRGSVLPRLAYNDHSASLEFIMSNFTTNFTSPRFSFVMQVANPHNMSFATKAATNGFVDKLSSRTIDDEYAPSVFTSTSLMWKSNHTDEKAQNFWHWRTVCYTHPTHTRKLSTDVKTPDLSALNQSESNSLTKNNRLLMAYFGDENFSIKFNRTTVSFGKPEDGFYIATNYLSWTTLIGFGNAPADSFSLMVIAVLLAGVVCPLLVIVAGGIYLAVRKRRSRKEKVISKSQYQPIG